MPAGERVLHAMRVDITSKGKVVSSASQVPREREVTLSRISAHKSEEKEEENEREIHTQVPWHVRGWRLKMQHGKVI